MIAEDQQIINEFIVEAEEHLAGIENQLLSMEASAGGTDLEVVHQVFRNVHSIKGAASFLGFQAIGELSHYLESVLNLMRNSELHPDAQVMKTLLDAFDTLRQMVQQIERQQEFEIATHIAELQKLTNVTPGQPATSSVPSDAALAELLAQKQRKTQSPHPVGAAPEPIAASAESAAKSDVGAATNLAKPEANIRVPVSILDRLMNLAGELVLGRNQLLQLASSRTLDGIDALSSRIDQVTSELQSAIMGARMQQVATVFNRFPRLVRDVSQRLNKQVQLVMEGNEVELDKSILEAIADPLTHLIRNSIDHGIESPDARIAAGKPSTGTVLLKAFHQAGKVHLQVRDDGGGIHPAKLREKAVRKGLITAEQAAAMNDREAVRLIFRPGFSTAEAVTEVSGRGVGMDVVKTNIEKLGGTVEIDSVPGNGTSIHVTLPLTLAIIPSLIVESAGERYAIPESAITELVRVVPGDPALRIQKFDGAEVLRLRGQLLPLVRLKPLLAEGTEPSQGDTLREKKSSREEVLHLVVVEAGTHRYGMAVDAVLDPEQIVVKPLGRHLKNCRCLAGATVLGDGQVAFILDISGIAVCAQLAMPEAQTTCTSQNAAAIAEETQTVLIFRGLRGDLYAAPMTIMSRIERVNSQDVSRVGERFLLQYRGGALPLVELEPGDTASGKLPENIYVLVFQTDRREVGLIVPHLVDICDADCHVDTRGPHAPGVIGVMVLSGQFIRLLNMYELAGSVSTRAEGRDRVDANGAPTNAQRRGTVLLAEDSPFFREQITRFLESANLSVIVCEDGLSAWETLSADVAQIDFIVTDIEMPRLNGFEFCQRIRRTPKFAHLPVIALTSMSDARHIRRGAEVGITDYQIKMDRERLTQAIQKYIPAAK